MGLKEEMKAASRLSRMRMGQEVPDYYDVPSMSEIRVALVPLTEAELKRSEVASAMLDVPDNLAGLGARDAERRRWNVWQALRDHADLTRPLYDSVEEMSGVLEPYDIEFLGLELSTLLDYASPSIDGLTDEELEGLKKALMQINWSELSGRQWAAVKICLTTLLQEQLQGRLLSTISTEYSMEKTEGDESILNVSQS